jgi:hypothetical protein
MTSALSRRAFLAAAPALALVPGVEAQPSDPVSDVFPAHEPAAVREVVTVAHGNLARVKALVGPRPALARVSWDWGFGDWETPIDAASHMGHRAIAEYLLEHGARPTVFTAAMLDQVDVVKRLVEATPGLQRLRGPHGLNLTQHARAGGARAVLDYLRALGDADPRYPDEPLADAERQAILGEYAFGSGASERLRVARNEQGALVIQRQGSIERNLFHHGGLVFNPSGAEAVRIRFRAREGEPRLLIVEDGPVVVEARRT